VSRSSLPIGRARRPRADRAVPLSVVAATCACLLGGTLDRAV
jgi:hypothetical protein